MNARPSDLGTYPCPTTRLLLVDSHTIVCEGLSVLLDLEDDLAVIGHAASAAECTARRFPRSPDLIITEIDTGGPATVEELRRLFPAALLLVLSLVDSEDVIRAALAAGAQGYVLKESGRLELLRAIRSVVAGTRFLCDRATSRVVSHLLSDAVDPQTVPTISAITRSEREILSMVARGLSNKHIARLRDRSVRTIEKQRATVMRKLALRNAADLTRFALEHGLIEAGHPARAVQAAPSGL